MKVYIGQTRSAALIERLRALGFGEMTARGEFPPRRNPFAYDNGAFGDWKAGRGFDADRFRRDVEAIDRTDPKPDFIVCPDIVAGGLRSLEFSLAWHGELDGVAPLYVAVQDGMSGDDVAAVLDGFAGVFIGGSLPWKLQTGETWVRFAHEHGKPCHIGRVGTRPRVEWATRIGADSIDSCVPLWSTENLERFLDGLAPEQAELCRVPWAPPAAFWRGWGVPVAPAPVLTTFGAPGRAASATRGHDRRRGGTR